MIQSLNDQISAKDADIAALKKKVSDLSADESKIIQEKEKEIAALNSTHNALISALKNEIENGELKIKQLGDVLNIDFKDKIFFDSGSVHVKNNGRKVLDKLIGVLKNIKNKQIRVEGFTDNVPIDEKFRWRFASNWELSTERACAIVRYLQSKGIDPTLMKATGYGEFNPGFSNDSAEGKAQNRRIVVLLVPLDVRARFHD